MNQLQSTAKRNEAFYNPLSFNEVIIESIKEIKGKDIVMIDLRELHDRPTDYFIICSGESNTQIKAIAENIYKTLKDYKGEIPFSIEGKEQSTWILMDYFSTVVHIFYPEVREFYELEELWSDGLVTEFESSRI